MTPQRTGTGRLFIAAVLAAGLLGGCAAQDKGLERDAARQLQARVLEVTEASSQNNPAAALKALEGLEAELQATQERGDISAERRRSITTIATAVRADLEDAVAAAQAAAAAAAAKAAEEKAAADHAAAAAQAAQAPPPAPEAPAPAAPQPQPQQGNTGQNQDGEDDGNDGQKGKGRD